MNQRKRLRLIGRDRKSDERKRVRERGRHREPEKETKRIYSIVEAKSQSRYKRKRKLVK